MLNEVFSAHGRENLTKELDAEFVVIGGGIAGVCAAINAARNGIKVCLVQDRPVLGGNASSEVRLWILGATSHMGNNNRWSREGGIMDELLLENLYRNKEGNTVIFDTIMLEKVRNEPNIQLLLNTAVYHTNKVNDQKIQSVEAFCAQNSTHYTINGELFCDASGDGIVAFQAGASFRMGAESRAEFGEKMAPEAEETEMLGHSIYFYSKDTGKPIDFVKPNYADINDVAVDRINRINPSDSGSRLWWIEYGGNLDTIHQTEEIKWELWKVVYGVWDYIKNSGNFENVENLTLEWVGTVPGKRESRRFNGLYMLTQQDVVEQNTFNDAISFGGWSIDHHPGDGVYSDRPPCQQFHSKGIYQIPLRCFVSKDIDNLFFAGRIISSSHIAFGSTRVMATNGHGGQAVGMAASMCLKQDVTPKALVSDEFVKDLQNKLNDQAHFIPEVPLSTTDNLVKKAKLTTSSELVLSSLAANGNWKSLDVSRAQLLPLKSNTCYSFKFNVQVANATKLVCQLRTSDKVENYTPEQILQEHELHLEAGEQEITLSFDALLQQDQYAFICFMANPNVSIAISSQRVSGILQVVNGVNKAVSNNGKQVVNGDIGVDEFEFWIPERRPNGENLAFEVTPAINCFDKSNIVGGYSRPYLQANAWLTDFNDTTPELSITWEQEQSFNEITLHFDTDFDHALESSLWGHPEQRIPFCAKEIELYDASGNLIYSEQNNYQTLCVINLAQSINTTGLKIKLKNDSPDIPTALYQVIVK